LTKVLYWFSAFFMHSICPSHIIFLILSPYSSLGRVHIVKLFFVQCSVFPLSCFILPLGSSSQLQFFSSHKMGY
jgi:hypothetical protein